MAQVTTSTTVHDVVVIGSGAGGGTVTKVLADLGISVLLLEAGPMIGPADFKEHMWPYQVPHRGAGAKGQAYTGGPTGFTYSATSAARSSRASPTRSRRAATSRGSARACSAAARTTTAASRCGWPTTTSSRRPPTASGSTGRSATTTWRRTTTRPSASSASPARRRASAARPTASSTRRRRSARTTSLDPAVLREARHPRGRRAPGGHDGGAQRPAGVPLLRPVRPRLQDGFELRLELRPDLSRRWRPGACKVIANAMARELITDDTRQGHRRLVHRQDDRQREAGPLPHRRPRRQRLRVGAPAAQLEGQRPSAGARQLVRQGRPLPDGHRRLEHVGHDSRIVRDAALQLRRLRQSHSTCRGGCGTSTRS